MFEKKRGKFLKIVLIFLLLSPILIFSDFFINSREAETHVVIDNEGEEVKAHNKTDEEEKTDSKVTLCFAGDVMMDSYFADYISNFGVDYSWTSVASVLQEADIAAINLETSVSERGKTLKSEAYAFRSKPYTLQGLVNAGVDLVNLANNHTYDYGEVAFLDTMEHLEKSNILYSGAGKNLEEAIDVKILERNNLKVGFISFSEIQTSGNFKAGENKAGIAFFNKNDDSQVLAAVAKGKKECDILIVMLHWGVEYTSAPSEYQVELAHKIIDNGADGIIGHHPHMLQGIELYKEKPILYSIGNFIFLKKNQEAGKTAVFKLEFGEDKFMGGSFYPVYIDKCRADLLEEDDPMKKEIINRLSVLSEDFGTIMSTEGTF